MTATLAPSSAAARGAHAGQARAHHDDIHVDHLIDRRGLRLLAEPVALVRRGALHDRRDLDRLALGLRASSQMLYLPPKPCVVTAVRYAEGDSLEPAFERVRRYARENGHRLHAGALIRQVQCVRRGEHNVQTGLMYAPLDGDERQFGAIR